MNFTDICFILVLTILSITGYYRGFLRTIIGPLAFLAATGAAFLFFKKTNNVLTAMSIGLFGPIFLGWLINLLLDNTFLRNKLPVTSPLSRFGGLLFNAAWGGFIFLSLLAILIIMPLDVFNLRDVNDNARASMTYKIFKDSFTSLGITPPNEAKKCASGACSMSNEKKRELASDDEMQEIMNDPRVLKLISDPAMQAAIEKQDIAAIMSNPIIFELGKDPAFIAKAMRIYPKIKAATEP